MGPNFGLSQDTVFPPNFCIDDPLCIEKMTMKFLREKQKIGVPREYAKKVEKTDVAGINLMVVINRTDQSKLTILINNYFFLSELKPEDFWCRFFAILLALLVVLLTASPV